ncbi:MAG TPA: fumarylacetoacetate hydrolase family protein [Terracidiphilus sp.]|jgi:2-keto-4-pentenoate hydratase/2-oxohepta-3-ene-1,7-dioic acid hydratase in catechol pathway|nr:fumarylacetoacetate hydrolase family protein [Terracidiphilus sp.]
MKYCRFLLDDRIRYGAVEDLGGDLWISGPAPAPPEDLVYRLALEQRESADFDFEPMPAAAAELLTPVTPSKIICVGRNYKEHVLELGNPMPTEPLLFFKPPSSLLEPGGTIRLPKLSERVDFEGELGLVIGRTVRNMKPESDWRDVVRGFTLANDVSARDLQKKDVQWARAKGFDTFCPVGPIVSDEIDLEAGVRIETLVNGEVRQRASTLELIFPVSELLCAITAVFTLEPGDLILTGTPSGVGPLKAGDRVEVSVPGLGTLVNFVEAD